MTSYIETDHWTNDIFEDMISRSLLALSETKIHPQALNNGPRAFTPKDLHTLRRSGVIVPAPDRVVWDPGMDNTIDVVDLPTRGGISWGEIKPDADDVDLMHGYCRLSHFRRIASLPNGWRRTGTGVPYEILQTFAQNNGPMDALREFVTVDPNTRKVYPCMRVGDRRPVTDHVNQVPAYILNIGMQVVDDLRHQWTIKSPLDDTSVTLGAYAENVKSLLYARSLPMTATGRKRPILHAVAAHKRRLKSGIEIDITPFLRGVHTVEMGGSVFEVRAPARLVEEFEQKKEAKKSSV